MASIDLNCDLGEGFGVYQLAPEEEIFPLVTSANIACGFHAGDPQVMRRSVRSALRHGVAIGAHPGTPDLAGFGRRAMELGAGELENLLIYQIGALEAFCRVEGARVAHVKPHGWLYNAAAREAHLAGVIVQTLKGMSSSWILYALAGSELVKAAQAAGLPVAQEAFIDRAYQPDGSLVSRGLPGALLTDPEIAAQQCLRLAMEGKVRTVDGGELRIDADTLCIHGDNPVVLAILRRARQLLLQNRVDLRPVDARAIL